VLPLRGNVNTRLAKLDRDEYEAIVLAAAGLKRLGLGERIAGLLAPADSLPAAGQGALGIETLAGRHDLAQWLSPLNDAATRREVAAERAVSRVLGGSCRVPLAAYCESVSEDRLRLRALVASEDGARVLRLEREQAAATLTQAEALGEQLAQELIEGGAREILALHP
jgi:hydroxymethylbilane synthase